MYFPLPRQNPQAATVRGKEALASQPEMVLPERVEVSVLPLSNTLLSAPTNGLRISAPIFGVVS